MIDVHLTATAVPPLWGGERGWDVRSVQRSRLDSGPAPGSCGHVPFTHAKVKRHFLQAVPRWWGWSLEGDAAEAGGGCRVVWLKEARGSAEEEEVGRWKPSSLWRCRQQVAMVDSK